MQDSKGEQPHGETAYPVHRSKTRNVAFYCLFSFSHKMSYNLSLVVFVSQTMPASSECRFCRIQTHLHLLAQINVSVRLIEPKSLPPDMFVSRAPAVHANLFH